MHVSLRVLFDGHVMVWRPPVTLAVDDPAGLRPELEENAPSHSLGCLCTPMVDGTLLPPLQSSCHIPLAARTRPYTHSTWSAGARSRLLAAPSLAQMPARR